MNRSIGENVADTGSITNVTRPNTESLTPKPPSSVACVIIASLLYSIFFFLLLLLFSFFGFVSLLFYHSLNLLSPE